MHNYLGQSLAVLANPGFMPVMGRPLIVDRVIAVTLHRTMSRCSFFVSSLDSIAGLCTNTIQLYQDFYLAPMKHPLYLWLVLNGLFYLLLRDVPIIRHGIESVFVG